MYCRVPGPVARAAEGGGVGDGQAEVDELDLVLAVDQEVLRPDVVVDEPRGVDRRQPLGGLGQDLDLGRQVERPRLAEELQADALDELHDDEMLAPGRLAHTRRSARRAGGRSARRSPPPRAAFLPRACRGRGVLLADLDLQADRPPRLRVGGTRDAGHAPLRGLRLDRESPLDVDPRPARLRRLRILPPEHAFEFAEHRIRPPAALSRSSTPNYLPIRRRRQSPSRHRNARSPGESDGSPFKKVECCGDAGVFGRVS